MAIDHTKSTKYVKAIYWKFKSAIADYKAQSQIDDPFYLNGYKAKALEELMESLSIEEWFQDTEGIEKEEKEAKSKAKKVN